MSKVATIAWREFRQTVLRKVFLLAIIGLPLLTIAAIGLVMLVMFSHEQPPLVGTIALVSSEEVAEAAATEFDPAQIAEDRAAQLREAQEAGEALMAGQTPAAPSDPAAASDIRMGMGRAGRIEVSIEPHPYGDGRPDAEPLKDRVRRGELLAAAIVPPEVLELPDLSVPSGDRPRFELWVAENVDADHFGFIERRLGSAVVRVRAERQGMDATDAMAMIERPRSNTRRVMESGLETDEDAGMREIRAQIVPMGFMMLLWVAVFSSAQHLMMSTIEEKSNRVMEVLLSAVSPMQLIAGKILGHGLVGLLIVSIYSTAVVAMLVGLAFMYLIQFTDLVYLFVFFFMAYFMIASIMAAVGSAVTDIREANTLITPVMFVVMIPLFLWMPISQAPNGGIATAFSFIPPATPFVMILRIAADEPVPTWQIPAAIVWGYACVVGMVWMAAKIFRVGVLMYGKPPTPLQLIKWVRYA